MYESPLDPSRSRTRFTVSRPLFPSPGLRWRIGTDARTKACRADRLGSAKRVAWAEGCRKRDDCRSPPLGAFPGGAWLRKLGGSRPSGK